MPKIPSYHYRYIFFGKKCGYLRPGTPGRITEWIGNNLQKLAGFIENQIIWRMSCYLAYLAVSGSINRGYSNNF